MAKIEGFENIPHYPGERYPPTLLAARKLNHLYRRQHLSKLKYPEILLLGSYPIPPRVQNEWKQRKYPTEGLSKLE